jgi:dihydroorotate dehydrogenase (NAD+) catalytic subunit
MITLSNGHSFEFCCASGALGFDGGGYFWDKPLLWAGLLPTQDQMTTITKTITLYPRRGNLNMWAPWRCVRLLPDGGVVNAVGLTNPGYAYWEEIIYSRLFFKKRKVILSIAPFSTEDAEKLAMYTNLLSQKIVVAIELNLSCPNVEHEYDLVDIVEKTANYSNKPIIAKLAYNNLHLVPNIAPYVEAFDLINTVPWSTVFHTTLHKSPLYKYGLHGGVSGKPIRRWARDALRILRDSYKCETPVISGGGVDNIGELILRKSLGADAFSIGSLFLRRPWAPKILIHEYQEYWKHAKIENLVKYTLDED